MVEKIDAPATTAFERSRALHERASQSLAGGVSTAFRSSERPVPMFFERARGARLVDVDGREYIDFVCGFGPVILGHSHAAVATAVADAARTLQQPGGQHLGEVDLAEQLCVCFPSLERVRFASSGSEAVHAALRVARAATDRMLVVKFAGHYHGWFDGMFTSTSQQRWKLPDSRGQPLSSLAEVVVIEWNDEEALGELFRDFGDQVAAVIMEPYQCNAGVFYPRRGYLELVRSLTREYGALLVFDEVITGFRIGIGGAQAELGISPDLTVLAKAMANGYPIAAFGGRGDVMELAASNTAVHAGTYNGNGVVVAAALATIAELSSDPPYAEMRRLGTMLMEALVAAAARHGHQLLTRGPGPVFFAWFATNGQMTSYSEYLRADFAKYARFAERMLEAGVRVIPAGRWYLSAAHRERDIEQAVEASEAAFAALNG